MTERLTQELELTNDDLNEKLSNGRTKSLPNRVYWSFLTLEKAGKVKRIRPGTYQITDAGRQYQEQSPVRITNAMLSDHVDPPTPVLEKLSDLSDEQVTPEEQMDRCHRMIRDALADQIVDKLKAESPTAFEEVVIDLLVAMGYGGTLEEAGKVVGRTGDGGIDGIVKQDKLGFDNIYVQAKRWDATIGRPEVQRFSGALTGLHATKGVMITTSRFTPEATEYARNLPHRLILIDGPQLANLMIEHSVGVNVTKTYVLQQLDSDYFTAL